MFADTSGLASLLDERQTYHVLASTILRDAFAGGRTMVTTNLVLAELTALLTSPLRMPRPRQIEFLKDLRGDPRIEILRVDDGLGSSAWGLWEARLDKSWSLVDCASSLVMERSRLHEALTTDHHFEQAGFVRLLKPTS